MGVRKRKVAGSEVAEVMEDLRDLVRTWVF